MGYTNRREKMKWRDKNTKKLKYYSSAKFDEHNNKFSTGWFPDSNFLNVTYTPDIQTIKLILIITPLLNMTSLNKP